MAEKSNYTSIGEVITHFANRHPKVLLALIGVITLLLSLWAFNPSLATWGDNAEFVILSQSISQGEGFKLINYPDPIPNKRYPPGFPLLLTPMILLFGTNIVLLKAIVVISYLISILGIFFILRQLITNWIAFLITLVISSNFILLNFSCQLMAEIPYLCFSVLSLCFYFSYERAEPGKKKKGYFSALPFVLYAVFT
jgi:4-amino-4-deoxy-L-arabinose transferase-like glycosyltransferase